MCTHVSIHMHMYVWMLYSPLKLRGKETTKPQHLDPYSLRPEKAGGLEPQALQCSKPAMEAHSDGHAYFGSHFGCLLVCADNGRVI